MHRLRVVSALALVLPFLLVVQFGSPSHLHLLISVAILLCAWEFAWLCPVGGNAGMALLTVAGALTWQWLMVWGLPPTIITPLVAGAMLVRVLVTGEELRTGVIHAAWTVLGVAFVGGLFTYGALLRNQEDGRQLIYFLTCTTWAGDIGAYYVGSRLGRRPLAPKISPKKTVEGALGGIAAPLLVAVVGQHWIWPGVPVGTAIWVGGVLAAVGMLGDLAESAIKRAAGVKDSGRLIPGHGGVLDRLDSLFFAGPTLYALRWLGWM
jgi:phosphatidate cytidylyltransferase